MRSRLTLFTLAALLAIAPACTSKPSSDNANGAGDTNTSTGAGTSTNPSTTSPSPSTGNAASQNARAQPIEVPARTSVTVRLGAALGSKLSQAGQNFSGTVAKDVQIGGTVAIPQGTRVAGTVVDAKPLGKLAGGALLQIRLDSINLNGADLSLQTSARSFSVKGKGKRTGVMAGGGAVLGGIIGGLAGGGKGAAVGMAAGGGAGAGGSAYTGNKDVVLPAESAVTFQLTQPLEITQ